MGLKKQPEKKNTFKLKGNCKSLLKKDKINGKRQNSLFYIFVEIMLTLLGTDDKISFVAERHKQLKKRN